METAQRELKEMFDTLNGIPKETIKHHFQEKSDILIKQFNEDFKSIPDTDPIKINCLNILISLGVNPYKGVVITAKE